MKINIDFPIETEFYEFKTSLSELDKGIETIAAMLNKHGRADVFYGVSNNGDAIGLKGQIGLETIKKVEKVYVSPASWGEETILTIYIKGEILHRQSNEFEIIK